MIISGEGDSSVLTSYNLYIAILQLVGMHAGRAQLKHNLKRIASPYFSAPTGPGASLIDVKFVEGTQHEKLQ